MKIIRKLKALFYKNSQPIALVLAAAEIREGRAYLHPKSNRQITYRVRSDDIEIYLNRDRELSDEDIVVIDKNVVPPPHKKEKTAPPKQHSQRASSTSQSSADSYDRFKKRIFSVSLYQHEYDALMETIKEYGYKRAEFIMASANTATKGSMERERKKIVRVHKEMQKEKKNVLETKKTS